MSIQVKSLTKSYGDRVLLDRVSLYLTNDDRVGLIGPNGCGKSTLIKIITGEEDYDSGTLSIPGDNFAIGYLEQFADIRPDATLLDEALRGAEKLNSIESRMRELEELMSSGNNDEQDKFAIEYSNLLEKFEYSGGYSFETDVKSILTGLGFRESDWTKPAAALSGGERTRLSLARLLSEKRDFIFLDEPTNHLDLNAIEWLESTLKSFKGGYLIVSHDRRFLDASCPVLYEIEGGTLRRFTGGYEGYLKQKAELLERERKMYESQQKEVEQLRKFIARWSKDKIKASMAMSRQKRLDKILDNAVEVSKRDKAGMNVIFQQSVKSWEEVISVSDLSKSFDRNKLFNDVSFKVSSGDHLAVIGRNGSGKTTLLRIMIGQVKQDSGEVWWGERTVWGYFSQRMEELNHNNNVFDELIRLGRNISGQDARNLLGRFLFSGDDIEKKVGELSGGERSKLMFAVLLTRKPNCMILDEPTNHLDLPSREILEEALEEYDGTLLFVSHDRAFIDRLATHTLELSESGAKHYHGNYSDVLYRQKQEKADRIEEQERKRKENIERLKRDRKKARPRSDGISPEKLMNEIELIEAQIKSLEEELNQPEVYSDYVKAGEISRNIEEKKIELDILFDNLQGMIE
ncbi:MAG TPA: ATP-binding cassette domain-containing protein [bacterium]|jgi:ATP-binding cassette subfamily F protein 3